MTNQQAIDTVRRYSEDAEEAARQLAKEAYRRGSTDNISVIIVSFKHGDSAIAQEKERKEQEQAKSKRPQDKYRK